MKRPKAEEKLAKKRQTWIQRTSSILSITPSQTEMLLSTSRKQSFRINTLRAKPTERIMLLAELQSLGWRGEAYSWMQDGYTIEGGGTALRDSKAVAEGKVFIQNAASWLPVLALGPQAHDSILDVCAAPGGKTSHLAAIANNQAQITANDNSRPRLAKLQANMSRLGVEVGQYTLFDAAHLTRKLDARQFDKILLDAPCSGEGLMNIKREKDYAMWSPAQIKRLQQLQKRILTQAWQLLKPGGLLVYSTCTMAPEENEAVVDYLLRVCDDARVLPITIDLPNRVPPVREWNNKKYSPAVQACLRLRPSTNIEAFFVCKLQKAI